MSHEPLLTETDVSQDEEPTDTWLERLRTIYPRSLLFLLFAQYFNEGLGAMKMYAVKDIYKNYYEVEPATL